MCVCVCASQVSGDTGILQACLSSILGKAAVEIIYNLLDENNTLKFSVRDWPAVIRLANTILQKADPPQRPCLQGEGFQCVGNNSVSITSMGALIIRYSWTPAPLPWNRQVEQAVLDTGKALCIVLRECC